MSEEVRPDPSLPSNDKADSRQFLFAAIYDDLRARARRMLAAHQANSLSTTMLVHEAYTKLMDGPTPITSEAHFFNIAAAAMRQIMVDQARYRYAQKRDQRVLVTLGDELPTDGDSLIDMLVLDAALKRLRERKERLAQIVELHFFGGLSFIEIADLTDLSLSTVEREWRSARAFLYRDIKDSAE
jgi:RNA polymerase sigma factor (TIGR02999 family)